MAVLKHEGNRVHQLVFFNVLHIDPADGNTAALRIKEAGNERRQRGFSAAGGSDKRHRLSRADGKRNILHGIFCAVIAEGYLIQRHGAVLRMLRCARLRKRGALQNTVNAGDGVLHDHAVFAHEHQLGERQRDDRRDDDVKEQVQQHAAVRTAAGEQKAACNQKHKHAVDRQRIEGHRPAHLLCVCDDPTLVVVDGALELFEGENRLTEGLDDGNPPHVLHRLPRHVRKRVLILCHLLLHPLAGHACHHGKGKRHRHKAQKPQPPVECQKKRQKSRNGRHSPCLVGELVGKIGFRCAGRFRNRAAQLAAAELLDFPKRKRGNMLRHGKAQIGGDAERRKVRAHQPRDVGKHGGKGKHHRHPAVVRHMDGVFIVRRDLDDLPQDAPDVPKRHQRQQCAGGGKHPRKIA